MPSSPLAWPPPSAKSLGNRGFSLIELLTVIVVLGILASLAGARTRFVVDQAKIAKATGDIRALTVEVRGYQVESPTQALPATLNDINRGGLLDPWGNPYVFVNLKLGGTPRTDVFGVPLNTDFDIYSSGKDGASATSLTAGASVDDVVLAGDGSFIGRASRY